MAKSLIWKELRDYAPKVLLCKAFKGFVLYLGHYQPQKLTNSWKYSIREHRKRLLSR